MLPTEPLWGLTFVDGKKFALAIKKLGILLSGVTFVLKHRLLSPLEMHTLLGHFTWFFLLARSSLSCFSEVYSFARQPSEREKRALPPICVSELFAAVLILLQIRIDLRRLWLGLFSPQMPHTYLALELRLQPSVLVGRGNFRVCLIDVMIFCGSNATRMFSMSQIAIAKELRTTSESRSLLLLKMVQWICLF